MWPFTEGSRLQSVEEKDKNLLDLIAFPFSTSLLCWALYVFTRENTSTVYCTGAH